MKVAIIIPTMNRSEFILRQFRFFESRESIHPIYIIDSSNEENANKIKEGIKKSKKINVTYRWAPPGKDHMYSLLPLIKEKYCIQIGDDDLIIPRTISKCAEFLDDHSDYATCGGKQVDIRLEAGVYDKPWGIIDRQTKPLGRSLEQENIFVRLKDFWADPPFICFTVRRIEIERKIRNITKHLFLMDYVTEFIIWSALVVYGKAKVLDELGYIMQISDNRHLFVDYPGVDWFMMSSSLNEKWAIVLNGLSEILKEHCNLEEDSPKMARWIFTLYLIHQFTLDINSLVSFPNTKEMKSLSVRQKLSKKIRYFVSSVPLFKRIYYKFKTPQDVTRPESKYFKDFKVVKDFIEKNEVVVR